ncbi:GlxA family transcriptional regulator [Mesorhizobium sp.]|uniref:GlxA family transcriptional regulator n=1 Tax=Mesorhizobium sp. TaxID=1871066 RepID=UPI000FE792D6|nr:GlxA family transcriptional regulator [Mesorhizobium sp.]RWP29685.1 MAG: GlxA family transcriptional regulator [Mesorhizobium sp.]
MNALFPTIVDSRSLVRGNGQEMTAPRNTDAGCRLAVLLLPEFSQLSLSSFIDPLRLANSISGRPFFEWVLFSPDGRPVTCASGIVISVSRDFTGVVRELGSGRGPDMVIICAGDSVQKQASALLFSLLRTCRRQQVPISALGTATWLLAESGILDDTRCTIHWDKLAALSATFGRLHVTDSLFVRDRGLVTCAGEFASFDLAMELITNYLGNHTASAVCRHTTATQWRSGSDRQWAIGAQYTGASKKVAEAIRLMEQHIEDPLPLWDIAKCVGLSQRQIERLFRRYVSCSPMRHYLRVRLEEAKRLIEQTNMPLLEIALSCGFVSSSHFTKRFRECFGMAPSALRARRL